MSASLSRTDVNDGRQVSPPTKAFAFVSSFKKPCSAAHICYLGPHCHKRGERSLAADLIKPGSIYRAIAAAMETNVRKPVYIGEASSCHMTLR